VLEGLAKAGLRSAGGANVVKADTIRLDAPRLGIAIAVNLEPFGDKAASEQDAPTREAGLQVEVVVDQRYTH
jgi:hypothetical protein